MGKIIKPFGIEYELCEKLGEGLNSWVFRAFRRDKSQTISSQVALKILKSKTAVDLWKTEFEKLKQLSSPNCVRVLGFEWINGHPALVLEYIEGVTLSELLKGNSLSAKEIQYVLAGIQRGLEELHRRGLTHGDLAPGNVMISSEGEVKLIDFAALRSEEIYQVTPEFAAPEVRVGDSPSPETDFYSLRMLEEHLLGHRNQRLPRAPSPRAQLGHIVERQMSIADRSLGTQEMRFCVTQPSEMTSFGEFLLRPVAISIVLLFLTITSGAAKNLAPTRPHLCKIQVRGENWVEIKTPDGNWADGARGAFFSCETKLIQWRTAKVEGLINHPFSQGREVRINSQDLIFATPHHTLPASL